MRIGLSCNLLLDKYHRGGIATYTTAVWRNLERNKIKVLPCYFPNFKPKVKLDKRQNRHAFCFPYPVHRMLPQIWSLKKVEKEIEIYHSTDYRIPHLKNTPVIATFHDPIMFKFPQWCNPRFRNIKNYLIKKTINNVHHVITVSEGMVPELCSLLPIKENTITVIPLGVADYWFQKIDEMARYNRLKQLGLSPDFLLFIGSLQPRKNVIRIIQAFLALPKEIQQQYPLVIVGNFPWENKKIYSALQMLLASNSNNKWFHYLDISDLRILYQSATLFIFPSLYEGFGLPILEAFASQTPVITSNCYGCKEVSGGAAYLVDPYCNKSLMNAIYQLIENSICRRTQIIRGLLRARKFTWNKCIQKTINVYHQFI